MKPLLKPRRPNYPRWVQREMKGHGPTVIWIVSEYCRPLRARLVTLNEKEISAGEFRCLDAQNAALTIISIMVFYFSAAPVLSRILRHDSLRPREATRRRRAVQDFLEHGLFLPGAGLP